MTERRFEGSVVFVTGVARGQGREHAVRFAREGASVIGVDLCADLPTVGYPLANEDDLAETVRLVEAEGGAMHAEVADVRDLGALTAAVTHGVERFGRLDTIVANAGIYSPGLSAYLSEEAWDETIDVNLTGVWKTIRAGAAPMLKGETGGSIVIISSTTGLKAMYGTSAYSAAKHGLVGLARSLARELAPHQIRVNTVHPTSVATPMILNDFFGHLVRPDLEDPGIGDIEDFLRPQQPLGVPYVQPGDVSDAVLWLASNEARWITGAALPVDAGNLLT